MPVTYDRNDLIFWGLTCQLESTWLDKGIKILPHITFILGLKLYEDKLFLKDVIW